MWVKIIYLIVIIQQLISVNCTVNVLMQQYKLWVQKLESNFKLQTPILRLKIELDKRQISWNTNYRNETEKLSWNSHFQICSIEYYTFPETFPYMVKKLSTMEILSNLEAVAWILHVRGKILEAFIWEKYLQKWEIYYCSIENLQITCPFPAKVSSGESRFV